MFGIKLIQVDKRGTWDQTAVKCELMEGLGYRSLIDIYINIAKNESSLDMTVLII